LVSEGLLLKRREPLTHRHNVTSPTTPPLYKAYNTQVLFTFLGLCGQNLIYRQLSVYCSTPNGIEIYEFGGFFSSSIKRRKKLLHN